MGKHTLQGEMYANSIGKIASFAVHTDFDQIPADVAAVAKLGLTDFCLFSCRNQCTGQQNILNYLNIQGLKKGLAGFSELLIRPV